MRRPHFYSEGGIKTSIADITDAVRVLSVPDRRSARPILGQSKSETPFKGRNSDIQSTPIRFSLTKSQAAVRNCAYHSRFGAFLFPISRLFLPLIAATCPGPPFCASLAISCLYDRETLSFCLSHCIINSFFGLPLSTATNVDDRSQTFAMASNSEDESVCHEPESNTHRYSKGS